MTPSRRAFEGGLGFPLDGFQVAALDAIDAGHSVLVAAPTGSGKTVVAEYAVHRAVSTGGKVFYTTPLKALSNQKFGDLGRRWGAGRVGLLTGDNSIRGDAPIVVMTTEVLRNMIYAGSPNLDGLRYVVLDEVHYLQDRYRGAVWEEVIVHLPSGVDLVALSATVSNAEEVADWIRTVRGDTSAIIEERRPVELVNLYLVGERGGPPHLLPTLVGSAEPGGEPRPNPDAARLDRRRPHGPRRDRSRLVTPYRSETVELLAAESMLPAIYFVFSRAGCDRAVEQLLATGSRLTTPEERAEIRRIAESHTDALGDDDLHLLRYGAWLTGLEAGFAAHHAGMVPPMKEAVEEAFARGLVKVVFATETLALGVNMPARSVVIEKLSKFTGEHHEFLTPGEYTQLTGRAGRRGIDDRGYAVVLWNRFVPFDQVAALATRRSFALTSSFRPNYNMAANLVRRHGAEEAHHLLNLSFAQYQADRAVVALERQVADRRRRLEQARSAAHCERGDVDEYRRLRRQDEEQDRERRSPRRIDDAIAAVRPGDVFLLGRRGGRVLALRHEHGRSGTRILALTSAGNLVRLGRDAFDRPPRAIGSVDLPRPFAPRNPAFRRAAARLLHRARLGDTPPDGAPPDGARPDAGPRAGRGAGADRAGAAHPVAACPDAEAHVLAAVEAERLERELARLLRRVRGRSESIAREFDRVLRVLEAWGYVEGWSVTEAGALLGRIYAEADLLLAEALRRGLFDGLGPAATAALASCVTYEPRGRAPGAATPVRMPTPRLGGRYRDLEKLWRTLAADEDDAGLPETRAPDPGIAREIHAWVEGADLADLVDDDLTAGDFVRHVKRVVDLLTQLEEVAPPAVAEAAGRAVRACRRGVVAASSSVGGEGP